MEAGGERDRSTFNRGFPKANARVFTRHPPVARGLVAVGGGARSPRPGEQCGGAQVDMEGRTTWSSGTGALVWPSSPCHDSTASHLFFSVILSHLGSLPKFPARPHQCCPTTTQHHEIHQFSRHASPTDHGPSIFSPRLSACSPLVLCARQQRCHSRHTGPETCVTCFLTCSAAASICSAMPLRCSKSTTGQHHRQWPSAG